MPWSLSWKLTVANRLVISWRLHRHQFLMCIVAFGDNIRHAMNFLACLAHRLFSCPTALSSYKLSRFRRLSLLFTSSSSPLTEYGCLWRFWPSLKYWSVFTTRLWCPSTAVFHWCFNLNDYQNPRCQYCPNGCQPALSVSLEVALVCPTILKNAVNSMFFNDFPCWIFI